MMMMRTLAPTSGKGSNFAFLACICFYLVAVDIYVILDIIIIINIKNTEIRFENIRAPLFFSLTEQSFSPLMIGERGNEECKGTWAVVCGP